MEDVARFGLDDAELCAAFKDLRHALREAVEAAGIDRGLLLACRDTPGDAGAAITTEGERRRDTLAAVAAAAGARLGEALRCIEECLKLARPWPAGAEGTTSAAAGIESLRYRAYAAEQRLGLALGSGRARQWRLCVIITERLCRRPWEDVAASAIAGGADCLQLREKELTDRELLRRAAELVRLAAAATAPRPSVIINDRADVALLSGADGVHVGQEDLRVMDARRIAGFSLLVGVSTENLDQARSAARDGADYLGVGPMFFTATKATPRIAGPEHLRAFLGDPALASRPHLAIGGITPENITMLRDAGCRGVAVSSAVCGADDPGAVCRALRGVLERPGC